MNEFQEALEGKITTESWDAAKLVEYHKFLTSETTKEKSEVSGLREAKRAEIDRVEKLKLESLALEEKNKQIIPPVEKIVDPQMTQFRQEQVEKAKLRLWSDIKLTDEEKTVVLEKFTRLDTGKLDADFIYQDLLSAVAASNPTKFLELSKTQERAEQEAQDEIARQASEGIAPPSAETPKKYSDEVVALAKKAGITSEAALKQTQQGMTRVYA